MSLWLLVSCQNCLVIFGNHNKRIEASYAIKARNRIERYMIFSNVSVVVMIAMFGVLILGTIKAFWELFNDRTDAHLAEQNSEVVTFPSPELPSQSAL